SSAYSNTLLGALHALLPVEITLKRANHIRWYSCDMRPLRYSINVTSDKLHQALTALAGLGIDRLSTIPCFHLFHSSLRLIERGLVWSRLATPSHPRGVGQDLTFRYPQSTYR